MRHHRLGRLALTRATLAEGIPQRGVPSLHPCGEVAGRLDEPPYGLLMARYEIDREEVSKVGGAISRDAATLRAVAEAIAAASAAAGSAVGTRQPGLTAEIDRFRLVHARLVDAMADAVTALGGDLGLAVRRERDTELAAASALGSVTSTLGSRLDARMHP